MGESMDQSKSNNTEKSERNIEIPHRGITAELLVGVFALLGVAALGYQAVGLAGISFLPSNEYTINAEFDNVSGLKAGASVEIAGVPVGSVSAIKLDDPSAIVVLEMNKSIKIYDEDIASIRTQGLIGDRYVKISRGASTEAIPPGGTVIETESVVDIEDIIGKIVHSMTGENKDKDSEEGSDL